MRESRSASRVNGEKARGFGMQHRPRNEPVLAQNVSGSGILKPIVPALRQSVASEEPKMPREDLNLHALAGALYHLR